MYKVKLNFLEFHLSLRKINNPRDPRKPTPIAEKKTLIEHSDDKPENPTQRQTETRPEIETRPELRPDQRSSTNETYPNETYSNETNQTKQRTAKG